MSKAKKDSKTEHILTEETLYKKFRQESKTDNSFTDKTEANLAYDIFDTINKESAPLTEALKLEIKQNIHQSIRTYKFKRIYWVASVAAVLLLVLAGSILIHNQARNINDITSYAETVDIHPDADNTRLILQGEKEVLIESKNAELEYDDEGGVVIDKEKEFEQETTANEVTFNTIIVPYGKRSQITLADNSTVWLNSGSKLVYPAKFAGKKREVFLEGEAIFDVSHNAQKPFYVVSKDVEVKVLGTVFNVSAYPDDDYTNTVLESGSVELKYNSNSILKQSKITITPGTLAQYTPSSKTIKQQQVNTKHYTSWRNGELFFESEPLANIIKKVGRFYNVEIKIANPVLSKETFSGYLDLKQTATEVLDVIARTMELNITEIENQIIIK